MKRAPRVFWPAHAGSWVLACLGGYTLARGATWEGAGILACAFLLVTVGSLSPDEGRAP